MKYETEYKEKAEKKTAKIAFKEEFMEEMTDNIEGIPNISEYVETTELLISAYKHLFKTKIGDDKKVPTSVRACAIQSVCLSVCCMKVLHEDATCACVIECSKYGTNEDFLSLSLFLYSPPPLSPSIPLFIPLYTCV